MIFVARLSLNKSIAEITAIARHVPYSIVVVSCFLDVIIIFLARLSLNC